MSLASEVINMFEGSLKGHTFSKEDGFTKDGVYLLRDIGDGPEIMGGPFNDEHYAISFRDDFNQSGFGSSDKKSIKWFRLDSNGKVL